METFCYNYIM